MRWPRPSNSPPPPSCLAPSWTPCTDRSYTHAKPLLRAQTTRAERPHHSTKQHTHTLTHTHKATPTTRTLYIQYMGGGGKGYTIYDAVAADPDAPADASAQGVLAGRVYTAPGRQGHPASGPGTMHASRAQPGPLAGWCAPYHPPRRPHRRSRDPCCTQSTTTNTTQTGATVTGWRHGQVTAPGTLPTHLPLLHPLPTRQWGCNWGRRHVHSPTTCTLLPSTPPRWCNRDRGHWLGHHTTNVTVPATATVAVTTHTSTPTTHSRPTPRHLSRRRQ